MATRSEFDKIVRGALNNTFLQTALNRATGSFKGMRTQAVAQFEDFEDMRRRARDAKNKVLDNLEYYLTRLEESVTNLGGKVHWAEDGRSVIDYVTNLAGEKGLKRVVKGKSMTSEEIDLNPGLEDAGLDVLETDLGEYIIQLVGERPSHIVGPAIHKTKEEIACLLEERLGMPYTDEPRVMTQAVREELRTRFLQADMGITGANFAVAETGTIVLLENEGNIRMSTTLPKIHVAVMGIEKVVADLNDLSILLRMLPLSAVGQRLPSYVNILTGPGRVQGEGPEEFHLVILDNFRTKVLNDPVMRQVLRCLRCGACLNFCPVYRRIGGHSYPWVYSGPIGVVLTGAAQGPEAAENIAGASTLCKACGSVCPVMIDLPGLIMELRERRAREKTAFSLTAKTIGRLMAAPFGFDMIQSCMGAGSRIVLDSHGKMKHGPDTLRALGEGRVLPRPALEPFHRSMFRGDEE